MTARARVEDEGMPLGAVFQPPRAVDVETIARNIRRHRGERGLLRLLAHFRRGTSYAEIALRFRVSVTRVHQWHEALGTTVRAYRIHPDILALAEKNDEPEVGSSGPFDAASD